MTRFARMLKWEVPVGAALMFALTIVYDHSFFKSYSGSAMMAVLGCIFIASARFSGKETRVTQVTYIAGALAVVCSILLLIFMLFDI